MHLNLLLVALAGLASVVSAREQWSTRGSFSEQVHAPATDDDGPQHSPIPGICGECGTDKDCGENCGTAMICLQRDGWVPYCTGANEPDCGNCARAEDCADCGYNTECMAKPNAPSGPPYSICCPPDAEVLCNIFGHCTCNGN